MPATSTWDGHAVWEVCPVCDANIYDNREQIDSGDATYASGKQRPVFKCSDRDCGWAVWPERAKKGRTGQPRAKQAPPGRQGGFSELQDLFRLYKACLAETVLRYGKTWAGKHPDATVAATATLFIQASRANVVLPAPPPPKPLDEPPPELEDEDEENPLPF